MNNNKVFETEKMHYREIPMSLMPKDKTNRFRVAKVGAGVVILPDNGSPITAKEVVKALDLKDIEPEEKERTKIIIDSEYHEKRFCVSLTDSQIKFLEWMDTHGILNGAWEPLENVKFEEI